MASEGTCWQGDAIYERHADVLSEGAESSEPLIVTSRRAREVFVVLVDVWSSWSFRFRYSVGLGRSSRLRYAGSGCRLSHKWWDGTHLSRNRAAVPRGVDEWTANHRMAEEAVHALVAVRCDRDIRFVVTFEVTGQIRMLGTDVSSIIRRPLRGSRSYASLLVIVG